MWRRYIHRASSSDGWRYALRYMQAGSKMPAHDAQSEPRSPESANGNATTHHAARAKVDHMQNGRYAAAHGYPPKMNTAMLTSAITSIAWCALRAEETTTERFFMSVSLARQSYRANPGRMWSTSRALKTKSHPRSERTQ
jgi:hypothetical protein